MSRKLAGVVLVFSLGACGGGAAAGGGAEVAPEYEGPVQSTDTARGEEVFTDVCGRCHDGGRAPNIRSEAHPVAMIRMVVRQGDGGMPPFDADEISDDDLEAVLAFMVSIQAAN